MNGRVLLDTNILVYIYDSLDPVHGRAIAIVERLITTARAVISPQVMGEFFIATTRPNRSLLTPPEAIARIQNYLTWQPTTSNFGMLKSGHPHVLTRLQKFTARTLVPVPQLKGTISRDSAIII